MKKILNSETLYNLSCKLDKLKCDFDAHINDGVNPHNGLEGLQGGQENEYYHLTETQYNCVTENCADEGIGTWGAQGFNYTFDYELS